MDPQSLLMFFSLRQPRRIRVIENLLSGRGTVSTLFWGMRYRLLGYLGTLKSINRTVDTKSINFLIKRGLLMAVDHQKYQLTSAGGQFLKSHHEKRFNLKFNLRYQLNRFQDRFLLAIQVTSEFSYGNRNYYPLQIDFRDASVVKRWFHHNKTYRLVARVRAFTQNYLNYLGKRDPTLAWQAANFLIGHAESGQTVEQMSTRLHLPVARIKFRQLAIICDLITYLRRTTDHLFLPLLEGLQKDPVSNSARLTFRMIMNGFSLGQIMRRQSLKISTVREHLLMIAILNSQFPYRRFLSRSLLKVLQNVYHGNPDQWQYQQLQGATERPVNFFYFRLYQIMRSKQDEQTSPAVNRRS